MPMVDLCRHVWLAIVAYSHKPRKPTSVRLVWVTAPDAFWHEPTMGDLIGQPKSDNILFENAWKAMVPCCKTNVILSGSSSGVRAGIYM